jgi:hypothetical protein
MLYGDIMKQNLSILLGIFLGIIIAMIGIFSSFGTEVTLSFSAFVTGVLVGYFMENKQLKFGAIAVIIQQMIVIGVMFLSDPDLNIILKYRLVAGLFFAALILEISFNILLGVLGSFIGSIAKKFRN